MGHACKTLCGDLSEGVYALQSNNVVRTSHLIRFCFCAAVPQVNSSIARNTGIKPNLAAGATMMLRASVSADLKRPEVYCRMRRLVE